MKYTINDTLYIQVKDLAFFSLNSLIIPHSLYLKTLYHRDLLYDDSKRNIFLKTTNKKDIEIINKLDWVLDYDEIKDKNLCELEVMLKDIETKKNNIIIKYNLLNYNEKLLNKELYLKYLFLNYKENSLLDYILYKKNMLKLDLPEGKNNHSFKTLVKSLFKK